jgi:ADP-ribose pyrophosphatase YjhB (NUDIX family)
VEDRRREDAEGLYPERVFRFCPRCGSGGLSTGNDRSFVCTGCGFEYYINAAAAVAALIRDHEQRLLLTRRAREPRKGSLDLPGGFVGVHETAEHALAREVMEELNLEVTGCSYFCSVPNTYPYGGITYFTLDLAFVCSVSDLSAIRTGDDADGHLFVPLSDIRLEDIGFDSIREIVDRYVRASHKA